MDNIWDRKVIGRGGDEKTEWPRRTDKRRTLKTLATFESSGQIIVVLSNNNLKGIVCNTLI